MELNEKLIDLCTKNFAYYKSKYNKNFSNMLNYSLMDKEDMIGGLSRYVSKGEDKYLLTQIFEKCKSDYSAIPEIVVLKYKEYFPNEIVELVEERLNDWCINYKEYLNENLE